MDTAEDRTGFYRGAGLALIAVGGLLAGAITPALGDLTGAMEVWAVVVIGIAAATFAVAVLPTPVAEMVFAAGLIVLGSLLVSAGLPGWLSVVSIPCMVLGFVLRFFNDY